MKEEKDILSRINRRDGMTVPDGFFADFADRMAQSLPTTEFELSANGPIKPVHRTFWQRVRPYTYLAAMFAGVWCMLKMFTTLTGDPAASQMSPSPVLANALDNEVFVNDYVIEDVNQWDLMDEMMDEGFDVRLLSLPIDEAEPDQMQKL